MSGEPREEVGPYIVYEQLGSGGMATVHRAEQRGIAGFRRVVALKRLHANVAADPDLLKSFIHEARLASYLKHTNVAQTFDLGKVGETYFIAMEFVAGPTLGQLMRQCAAAAGPIPLGIVLTILIQICDALDHAHNLCDDSGRPLGIIHRDVSPSNVIVSNTGTVKLIDFGIAKASNSDVRTQTGMIKGKFGYIAPEYLTGQLDLRGDLFGVGVIAHELIAGRPLFLGRNDFDTLSRLREMPILPPSRWNPSVPPDLDDIVMTGLQRDPDQRWQSAAAMRNALQNALREVGAVITTQQVYEWVEWAFTQVPQDAAPVRPSSDRFEVLSFGPPQGGRDSGAPSFRPMSPGPAPLPSAFAPGASPPPGFTPDELSEPSYLSDPTIPPPSPSPYRSDLVMSATPPGFAASGLDTRDSRDQVPTLFDLPSKKAPIPAPEPRPSRDRVPTRPELPSAQLPPSAFAPETLTPSAFAPETLPPSAFAPETLTPSAFAPETLPPSAFTDTSPEPPPPPPHLASAPAPGPAPDPAMKLAAAVLAPALPVMSPSRAKGASTPPVMATRDKSPSSPIPAAGRSKPVSMPPAEGRVKPPSVPPDAPDGRAKPPSIPPPPPPSPATAGKPPPTPPAPASATKPPPVPGMRAKSLSVPPPVPGAPGGRSVAAGSKPPPLPRPSETDSLGATEPNLPRFDASRSSNTELDPTDPVPRASGSLEDAVATPPQGGRTLDLLAAPAPSAWPAPPGAAGAPADGASPRRPSFPSLPGASKASSSPGISVPAPGSAAANAAAAAAAANAAPLIIGDGAPNSAGADSLADPAGEEAPASARPRKDSKKEKAARPTGEGEGKAAKPAKPAKAKPSEKVKAAAPPSRRSTDEESDRGGPRWWVVLLLLLLAAAGAGAAAYYLNFSIEL